MWRQDIGKREKQPARAREKRDGASARAGRVETLPNIYVSYTSVVLLQAKRKRVRGAVWASCIRSKAADIFKDGRSLHKQIGRQENRSVGRTVIMILMQKADDQLRWERTLYIYIPIWYLIYFPVYKVYCTRHLRAVQHLTCSVTQYSIELFSYSL